MLLLFLGSGHQDCRSACAGAAHCYSCTGELFFDDVLVYTAAALAAVLLGPADSYPTLGCYFFQELLVVGAHPCLQGGFYLIQHLRSHLLLDELDNLLPEGLLFRCESKVHPIPLCRQLDLSAALLSQAAESQVVLGRPLAFWWVSPLAASRTCPCWTASRQSANAKAASLLFSCSAPTVSRSTQPLPPGLIFT